MLAHSLVISYVYEDKLFLRRHFNKAKILRSSADFLKRHENLRISQNCFRNLTYASNGFAKLSHLQHDAVSAP